MNLKESVIEYLNRGINFFPNIRKGLKVPKQQLAQILDDLVLEGIVYFDKRENCYYLIKTGKINIKQAGYGFISVDSEEEDYFVPANFLNMIFDGDEVKFADLGYGERLKEAYVIEVIKRANTKIIGKYKESNRKGKVRKYIVSSDPNFPVKVNVIKDTLNAVPGNIVYGEILYNNDELSAIIKQVLGNKDTPGIEIAQIALEYGFENNFNENVIEDLNCISDVVLEEQKKGRRDFTNQLIITIDGDDSKDFDDAVSVLKNPDGSYELGVYIADVSEYVLENSNLDSEALKRGTSVYLADRVIPMLPFKLSNGICSLNEGVDRLVLACIMSISKEGNLTNYEICEGVINSKFRMTYNNVNKIINNDPLLCEQYSHLVPMINDMKELSSIIRRRRHKKGGIEFDVAEYKFSLNNDGSPKNVVLRSRDTAEMLIEDFMLEANETVAYHMNIMNLACVYRVHEKPDQDKLRNVFNVISGMGINLKQTKNDIHPKQVQEALEKINDSMYKDILSNMLLRSMMKAKYHEECLGHYGLAMNYYCHFTSPIRRYPDLMVHRLIKKLYLHPMNLDEDLLKYNEIIKDIAIANSTSERKAVECERAVNDMLYAWFMEKHIGKEFDGIITSMTGFGMFISLENGVEGLVSLHNMIGYYYYDSTTMTYSNGKTTYKLGDKVKVVCVDADRNTRKVDFLFRKDYYKSIGGF